MERIAGLARQPNTKKSIGKSMPKQWTVTLFEKMRLRFGNLWTRQIGETSQDVEAALREWGQVLADIEPEQIAAALDSWDSGYPPNAYEFKIRCKAAKPKRMHQVQKMLPKPKANPEIARDSLKSIRQAL